MKELFKENKAIALVVAISMVFIGLLVSTARTNRTTNPVVAIEKSYEIVNENECFADDGHHVVFGAFFARDLDGDGRDERILGSCNKIGTTDTLLINIGVNSGGYLENGKITITAKQGSVKNFNYQVSMLAGEDDILANNCVSDNVTSINFKTIQAGRQKLISGNIIDALGGNPNAYKGVSQVTLTGRFVPDEGEPIQINKTFELTTDWYGTATTKVSTSSSSVNVTTLEENSELVATLTINSETKGLIAKERVVRVQIPDLFGYFPEIEYLNQREDTVYTYDEESHILTIDRDSVASSSIDKIQLTYPGEAYAPLKAKLHERAQYTIFAPVDAYSICHNNPSEGFQNPYQTPRTTTSGSIQFYVNEPTSDEFVASMSILDKTYLDDYSSGWSKNKFLEMYDADEPQTFEYRVENYSARNKVTEEPITVVVHNGDSLDSVIGVEKYNLNGLVITSYDPLCGRIENTDITIENGKFVFDGDEERKITYTRYLDPSVVVQDDDGTLFGGYNADSFITTKAISFNQTSLLKDDGYIKIYNGVTNELIKELKNGEWFLYSNGNKLEFDVDVSRIRLETSEDDNTKLGKLDVILYKEIDINKMKQAIPREDLERITEFKQNVMFTLYTNGEQSNVLNIADRCKLYDVRSYAAITVDPGEVSVGNESKNVTFTISVPGRTNDSAAMRAGWVDGRFLVKISKNYLTSLKVNSVTTRYSDSEIVYNTFDEDDDFYYIEVQTGNTENETIQDGDVTYTQKKKINIMNININGVATINPLSAAGVNSVYLYYYNPAHEMYISQIADEYDLDKDGNINDYVGYAVTSLRLNAPNDFKAVQSITNYSDNLGAKEVFAPGTVNVNTGRRTAKVNLKFVNRYTSDILNFKLQGKIPFENNTFINGASLGSTFSTKMTSDGITLPESLADGATVYYSENADPTDDLNNASNGWKQKEEFTSLDNVKSYLIVVENGKIKRGEIYTATYDIQIPEDIDSNEVSYCCFKASYDVYVNNGLLNITVQPDKLGMRMVQYYDINIAKYKEGTDRLVSGPVFRLNGTTITAQNGEVKSTGLVVNKEYTLEEINGGNFEIKEGEINFKVVKEGTGLKFVKLSSSTTDFDGDVTFVQKESGRYELQSTIVDKSKVRMSINKIDSTSSNPIKGVKFVVDNREFMTSDDEGKITFDVSLNEEHSIREYPNEGYYKIPEITFTVKEVDGSYVIESNNADFRSASVVNDNTSDFIEAEVSLKNELIPTYELSIKKVDKERETPLEEVKFVLKKADLRTQEFYTTDENGMINISNLYQFVDGKDITGKYTLQEVSGKSGYILNNEEIEFYVKKNSVNQLEIVITDEDNLESIKEHTTTSKKVNLVITNKPLFKLIKINGNNEDEVIPNVDFILYSIDDEGNEIDYAKDIYGEYVGTQNINGEYIITTDENGEISLPLPNGKYKVVEVGFPEGYQSTTNIQYFTVTGNAEEQGEEGDEPVNPDDPSGDEEEEEVTFDINYIEDLVDLQQNNTNGYQGYLIKLQRDLDFNDSESYRDATSTSYGDLNGDGIVEDIKTELTKQTARGFTPIGAFAGTFDGQNHKIDNIYINTDYWQNSGGNWDHWYVGLFEATSGTIKNLSVGGHYEVSNTAWTGGLAGRIGDGTIENCHSSVDIHIFGDGNYGSSTVVSGIASTSPGVYSHIGNIVRCSNSGNITGEIKWDIYAFGVGNEAEKCYNTGNINITSNSSNARVFGVASTARNCYNRGTITATSNDSDDGVSMAYGVGQHASSSYNTGNVYALGDAHTKFVDAVGDRVSNVYYLDTVETSTVGKTNNGTAKTAADMKIESFIARLGSVSWTLDGTKNDGFPIHTEADNIVTDINYIEDLVRLSFDTNLGSSSDYALKVFELKRDLDFNDDASYKDPTDTKFGDVNGNGVIETIKEELTNVNGTGFPYAIYLFQAQFNGNNHTISNFYMNKTGESYVSLFRSATLIEDLKVVGTIKADGCKYVSGIVSYGGLVRNCCSDIDITVTGAKDGEVHVNGIGGDAIIFSQNLGDISVQETNVTSLRVNGVGVSRYSYNRGNITVNFGNATYAFIYGVGSSVSDVYNTGNLTVTGTASSAYIDAVGDTVSRGFYSTDATISGTKTTHGEGKTLEYMKSADFLGDLSTKYWRQIAGVNDGLPVPNEMSSVYITEVNNIEDLIKIRNDVYNGLNYSNVDIKLKRSLDFNDDDSYEDPTSTVYGDYNGDGTVDDIKTELTTSNGYIPIGSTTLGTEFAGNFDGQGFEINNLYINCPSNSSKNSYLGLFGYVVNSKIENLTVSGEIRGSDSIYEVGGICGACSGEIEFNNCINKVNITAQSGYYWGGILGQTYYLGTISTNGVKFKNCKNYGTFSVGNGAELGGIAGYVSANYAEIEKCENFGRFTTGGGYYVGGIVGQNYTSTTMTDCYNWVGMDIPAYSVGGLYGYTSAQIEIKNCGNGKIDERNVESIKTTSSYTYTGGLIGEGYSTIKIDNCYNTMKIVGNSTGSEAYVGGIVGRGGFSGSVTNTYNYGDVEASSASYNVYAGGITGKGESSQSYKNVHNEGNVNASSGGSNPYCYVGGINGEANYSSSFENCSNKGNITALSGSTYIGGISGRASGGTYKKCINEGSITVTRGTRIDYVYCGGITGSSNSSTDIEYCENTGNVYVEDSAGLYMGGIAATGYVLYSHNAGTVTGHVTGGTAYCAGISGMGNVKNSYNTAPVTLTSAQGSSNNSLYIGGIGACGGTNYSIENSHNTGDLTCSGVYDNLYLGGVVANGVAILSYNTGNIYNTATSSSYTQIGGVAGSGIVKNTYNQGNIESNVTLTGSYGNLYVTGIVGYANDAAYSYNTGDVISNVSGNTSAYTIYTSPAIGYSGSSATLGPVIVYSDAADVRGPGMTTKHAEEKEDGYMKTTDMYDEIKVDEPTKWEHLTGQYPLLDTPIFISGSTEATEIVVKNTPLSYKITSEVVENNDGACTGGNITGEEQPNSDVKLVETVGYGASSTVPVIVTPDDGYKIDFVKINGEIVNFELNEEDNSMTIPAGYFTNIQRNNHITAKFEPIQSELIINKIDDLDRPVKDAEFEIKEIDVRPEIPSTVVGTLVNDGQTYTEEDLTSEITSEVVGTMSHATNQSYYFVERDGKYVSNNKGIYNSFAESYVKIDLTGRTGQYMLMAEMGAATEYNRYGYAVLTTSETPLTTSTLTNYLIRVGGSNNSSAKTLLTGGNVYYLHFAYNRNTTTMASYYKDEVYVNSVKVYGSSTYTPHFELEDGKYVAKELNGHIYHHYATSRIPLDLRSYTGKYDITINAEKTGRGYGYVMLDQSDSRVINSTGAIVSMNEWGKEYHAADYTTTIEAGKLYYLHLYYNNSYPADEASMIINSITFNRNFDDLYVVDSIKTNASGKINLNVKNGKYQVKELSAPEGYIKDETSQTVVVTTDSVNNLTFVNQSMKEVRVHYYMKGTGPEFDKEPVQVLADKYYHGYVGENYVTDPVLKVGKLNLLKDENNEYVIPSNATGTFDTAPIDVYYYYDAEIPQGSFKLEMTKIQENDGQTPVEGAEFDVYKMNAFEFTKIGTLTDQGNGLYSTENIAIQDAGELNIVIKETTVPEGYQAVDDILMTLTVELDEDNNTYVVRESSYGEVDYNRYENMNNVITGNIDEPLLNLNYEVHYYLDGVEDTDLAETELTAPYGTEISNYEDKCPRTYLFDKAKALDESGNEKDLPLVIKLEEDKNIINVYYKKAIGNFKLKATKVNAADSSIVVEGAKFDIFDTTGTTEVKIGTLTDKGNGQYECEDIQITEEKTINVKIKETVVPQGYKKVDDITGTITFTFDETNGVYVVSDTNLGTVNAAGNEYNHNIINMTINEPYQEYDYSIHYYYEDLQGVMREDTDSVESDIESIYNNQITKADIQDKIDAKEIDGFTYQRSESLDQDGVAHNFETTPLVIGVEEDNNRINVYYSRNSINYEVHYFFDGVDDTSIKQVKSSKYEAEISTYDAAPADKIAGHRFDKAKALDANGNEKDLPLEIKLDESKNRINVYYVSIYTINTEVAARAGTNHDGSADNNKGGTISGENENPYETVDLGESNTKSIAVEAAEGFVIKDIKVNGNSIDYSAYVQRSAAHKVVLPEGYFINVNENKLVTAEFKKASNVKVRYMVNGTETKLADDIDLPGFEGDNFSTEYKTFTGYKLNSIKDQDGTVLTGTNNVISGNMYADELVVTYWYDIDNASIIEKHILIDTDNTQTELSSTTHTGQVGTTKTLNRNTYDDYKAAEGTDTSADVVVVGKSETSKEVTYVADKSITVKFFYDRKDGTVKVHYMDEATNTEIVNPQTLTGEAIENPTVMNGKAGKDYTATAPSILGYTLDETRLPDNATGIYKEGNIDVYFYYTEDEYPYVINYITGDVVAETTTGKAKFNAEINYERKVFPNYVFDHADKEKIVIVREETATANVLNVYYKLDTTTVTEKHIDITDGGRSVLEEKTYTQDVGTTITLNRLTDEKYEAADGTDTPSEVLIMVAKTEDSKEVTFEQNKAKEVIFYYVKAQSTIIEKHIDITDGSEVVIDETPHTGNVGDTETLRRLTDNNYVGADAPANVPDGVILVGKDETSKDVTYEANNDKEVRFYYVKAETIIRERHIDITTGQEVEISSENHTGTVGSNITLNRLTNPKYEAADGTETSTDTLIIVGKDSDSYTETYEVDKIKEVRFYYVRKDGHVHVEYIDNITGEKISEDTVLTGKIDDSYEVTRVDIPGHKLDLENLPDNETGTYKLEDQTVTYTYIELRPYDLVVRYTVENGDNDQAKIGVRFDDTFINDYTTNGELKIADIELTDLGTKTYTVFETETPEYCTTVVSEEHPAVVELIRRLNTQENKYEFVANYGDIPGFKVIVDEVNKKVIFDITTEKIVKYDLAIRKFITKIGDKSVTDREPRAEVSEDNKITYVGNENIEKAINNQDITYTIRMYNESTVRAQGKRVIEYIPEGLVFDANNEVNKQWTMCKIDENGNAMVTNNPDEATIIVTDCLVGKDIPAFNTETKEVSFIDVQAVFKVNEKKITRADRIIENKVEIMKNNNDDNNDNDISTEKVYVKYFDLSIEKYIESVTVNTNGTEKTTKIGHEQKGKLAKFDVKRSEVNDTKLTITYGMVVKNVGEIPGYATELTDYVPENFKLIDNGTWTLNGNTAISTVLSDTLINPGESATVYITFEWNLAEGNIGTRRNEAEITAYTNEYDAEDVTKDNKDGEDLLVSIKTGSEVINIAARFVVLISVIALGIYTIKRKVVIRKI